MEINFGIYNIPKNLIRIRQGNKKGIYPKLKINYDPITSIFYINGTKVIKTHFFPHPFKYRLIYIKNKKNYNIFKLVLSVKNLEKSICLLNPKQLKILMCRIIKNKIFDTKPQTQLYWINECEKFHHLTAWNQFEIYNNIIYDLNNNILLSSSSSSKIKIQSTTISGGGIITTNSVNLDEVIKYFSTLKGKTAVVGDEIYLRNWKKFDLNNYHFVNDINFLHILNEKYDRIILHESTIPRILELHEYLNKNPAKNIWFLNMLPLNYYFYSEKLSLQPLKLIWKTWIKSHNKLDMLKHILINTNNIMINFNETCFELDGIKLNKTSISNYFKPYLFRYNGIKIYDKYLHLLTNTSNHKNFKDNLYNILLDRINRNEINIKTIRYYLNNTDFKGANASKEMIINTFDNEMNKMLIDIKNMRNYLNYTENINLKKEIRCDICFNDTNEYQLFLCGHYFCLECGINSIANQRKCPMCRCEIGIIDTIFISPIDINPFPCNAFILTEFSLIKGKTLKDDIYLILKMDLTKFDEIIFVYHNYKKEIINLISYLKFHGMNVRIFSLDDVL